MIKFRQKEYSGIGRRALRYIKGAINKADTKILNKTLGIHDKILGGKLSRPVRISPKSNIQLSRETIEATRGGTLDKIVMTPTNNLLDRGISYTIENPLAAAGSITPVPLGTAAGKIGDESLKFLSPKYSNKLSKARESYDKSRVSGSLKRHRLPTPYELSKYVPVV